MIYKLLEKLYFITSITNGFVHESLSLLRCVRASSIEIACERVRLKAAFPALLALSLPNVYLYPLLYPSPPENAASISEKKVTGKCHAEICSWI